MHGDTVVTKNQEGKERPLNKNKSKEPPLKMNRGVELLLRNYEPWARLVQVNQQPQFDRNLYSCTISFYVVNNQEPVIVESFLERLR